MAFKFDDEEEKAAYWWQNEGVELDEVDCCHHGVPDDEECEECMEEDADEGEDEYE